MQLSIEKRFKRDIQKIARKLKTAASSLSRSTFFAHSDLTELDLIEFGGFSVLQRALYPNNDSPAALAHSALISSHRRKLDLMYGKQVAISTQITDELKNALSQIKWHQHPPIRSRLKSPHTTRRVLSIDISDNHFGCNIDRNEVGTINEYNWTIAGRRIALAFSQVLDYKTQYRNETDLVISINGDNLAGVIHGQEWEVDLLTTQTVGALHILVQAISYVASSFSKIDIYMTPGNHGRMMHKASKDRATANKWDSHENILFHSLALALTPYKNIHSHIPLSPFALYKIFNHNIFQTHGDTIIKIGNPGKAIKMQDMMHQINAINSSTLLNGQQIHVAKFGHVHTQTVQLLSNGCMALINGCSSGTDPFANSIGIFGNSVVQLLHETVPAWPVGDIRFLQLKSADNDASLDKIIKPFEREMVERK